MLHAQRDSNQGDREMGLQVVKRNGEKEDVRLYAIQEKLSKISQVLNDDWVDHRM